MKSDMKKNEMRVEAIRLLRSETEKDCLDLIDIYIEFLYTVILNHHTDPLDIKGAHDFKIILQMITTKLAHLKTIINGINFNGKLRNTIIDPAVVANLVRNIYETVSLFNLIFVNPKNDDERIIHYNLWVYSGLKYRQNFSAVAITPENLKKVNDEKVVMENLIKEIKDTSLFKTLSPKNQGKIMTRIQQKEYKIEFDGVNNVRFLNWQDLSKVCGIKPGLMDNIYAYFSQYSHPTNVSVFQYANMFNDEDKAWKDLSIFNLKNAFFMISIFIADYIKMLPTVKITFEALPLQYQIAIDWQNTIIRGNTYSINNCINELD